MKTGSNYSLLIKTTPLGGGKFRSDWRTKSRQGYVITRPPVCTHRRALAELLALHAVTGLIRPLRFKDFQMRGVIGLSAWEILETLAGLPEFGYLRRYVRFITISLGDLHLEVLSPEDWGNDAQFEFMESLEVIRNDPWEDALHFPGGLRAIPTLHVFNVLRERLKTSTCWKVWATLYLIAPNLLMLPSSEGDANASVQRYLCQRYGWIIMVNEGRMIGLRSALPNEQKPVLDLLMARGSADADKIYTVAATYAIDVGRNATERLRILDAFVAAFVEKLPARCGELFFEEAKFGRQGALVQLIRFALEKATSLGERSKIHRIVLDVLPENVKSIVMPDGSRALLTGHLIERLMSRFNMSSPLAVMHWLHKNSLKLRRVELPTIIQVSKEIRYDISAVHWQLSNQCTIVVGDNGVAMTAYFRNRNNYNASNMNLT